MLNLDLDQQVAGSTDKDTGPWHALYTRHQHEKTIADLLTKKGFHVFLPLYNTTHRWKDRTKALSLPLFPSYVFVKGGLDRQLQILTTPGVYTILAVAGRAAVIPEEEISAVERLVSSSFEVEPHPFLKCGDRVRVTSGPLEGIEGILIRKKNSIRLVLSVELLMKSVAVEVDAWAVERIEKAVLSY
ncbi:MAG TPA: UpxY family transcription antiterminator [Terriglobia bacterium]|nr:UpxY family transcription antiterminator [Terriglobia bacterium]